MEKKNEIRKVLNNSSLLVFDGETEIIIIGKGIGFKRSPGEMISLDAIEGQQYHLLKDSDFENQLKTPKRIINSVAEILDLIQDFEDLSLSNTSLLAFTNHLVAMLIRIENDELFLNPFHDETKILYPEAYKLAQTISRKIDDVIHVVIPDSEIDFLTYYLHGMRNGYDNTKVRLVNAIVDDVNFLLEEHYGLILDKSSSYYARFITHVKFLVQRITRNEKLEGMILLDSIREKFPEYMTMSQDIGAVIERHLDTTLSDDEFVFIAIHLARLSLLEENH